MKFYSSLLISLYSILCTQYSFAQHHPLFFSSSQNLSFASIHVSPFFENESRICFANNFLIRNSLSEKPFFCSLEDKMYKRFNVWIKFRAGSDDIYRKMIASPYLAPKNED